MTAYMLYPNSHNLEITVFKEQTFRSLTTSKKTREDLILVRSCSFLSSMRLLKKKRHIELKRKATPLTKIPI